MDVSGTLHLDRAGVGVRRTALAARAADLAVERRDLATRVEAFLTGWRGAAAEEFRARWEAWRDGADGVVAALVADLAAIDTACADLGDADATAHGAAVRLRGRLG